MAIRDMDGKVCLVTGASQGIGKETAVGLARAGAIVVMHARDRARGEAAAADVRKRGGGAKVDLLLADLASLDEVRGLAASFRARYDRLDVLVNNAGAYHASRTTTKDGFETTWGVNHLAYVVLTDALLEMLKACAPSRIINLSSRAHLRGTINFDDLQAERSYGGSRAYGQSKLANVLFTKELARRLAATGVTANAVHPGVVRTGFGRNNGGVVGGAFRFAHVAARPLFLTPEKGAQTSIYLATSDEVEAVTGKYFANSREAAVNPMADDVQIAQRVWEVSEAMVKQPVSS